MVNGAYGYSGSGSAGKLQEYPVPLKTKRSAPSRKSTMSALLHSADFRSFSIVRSTAVLMAMTWCHGNQGPHTARATPTYTLEHGVFDAALFAEGNPGRRAGRKAGVAAQAIINKAL